VKHSLTVRILLLHFFTLALPLYIMTSIFFERFYVDAVQKARDELREVVEYKKYAFSALLPISPQALQDIAYFLSENKHEMRKQIRALNASGEQASLAVLQLPVTETGTYALLDERQLFGLKEFESGGGIEEILTKGQAQFIRYITLPGQPPALLFFLGKVIEKNKKLLGILLASVGVDQSIDELLQADKNTLSLALLNQYSVILAASDPRLEGQYFDPISEAIRTQLIDSGALGTLQLATKPLTPVAVHKVGFYDFLFQGKTYLGYRTHNTEPGFMLMAFLPKSALFFTALKQYIWIYVTYIIVLITGIVLAHFFSRWMTRPLSQLSQVMGEAHEGNLRARFEPHAFGFEINRLGQLFNNTLEALVKNIKQAEEERVKKETYSQEIAIGREVQKKLLSTHVTEKHNLELASLYVQAEDVGGDFYCAESLESNRIWMAVGDAAGKGVSSCLYSLSIRSLIRSYMSLQPDLGQVLETTNKVFIEQTGDTGMFVTVLAGLFDCQTSMLSYYSCGHLPGIIRHKDGALRMLEHSGMALGLIESSRVVPDQLQLTPGDLVLFYTKGLVEGVNDKNQFFSIQRLKDLLQQRKWITANEVIEGLNKEYHDFIGDVEQQDEVVILAFRILGD